MLEQAYDSLAPARQKLLGTIACFHWPVSYDTLKAAAESEDTLDRDLREIVIRGLLHHDVKERRFDLHPIVWRTRRPTIRGSSIPCATTSVPTDYTYKAAYDEAGALLKQLG